MHVRLEVAHQKANINKVVLKSDTVIGRSAECNLRIASSEVSRRHCRVMVSDHQVLVRDLGSSNGTFVDGEKIEPETDVLLKPDSELSLGSVRFFVRYTPSEHADEPASTVQLPLGSTVNTTVNDTVVEEGVQPDGIPTGEADSDSQDDPPAELPSAEPALEDTVHYAVEEASSEETVDFPALDPRDEVAEEPEVEEVESSLEDVLIDQSLETAEDIEETEPEPQAKKSWSFFGMFKRKGKSPEPEEPFDEPGEDLSASEQTVDDVPAEEDVAAGQETLAPEETVQMAPQEEDVSEEQENVSEVVAEDIEEQENPEPVSTSEEDNAFGFLSDAENEQEAPPADDDALGDFLNQLS
ncbi:MAG: hypothetical protein Tsb009_19310 [Planctomycetaceae bacterium]